MPKNKKNKNQPVPIIPLIAIFLIVILLLRSFTTKTFRSEKGAFAITLPSHTTMHFSQENHGAFFSGQVYFSNGLIVTYSSPGIDGKGGACINEKGEGAYKHETIAGQDVDVCEEGEFRASYFKHPTKKIEYAISSKTLPKNKIKEVGDAVRNSFHFE